MRLMICLLGVGFGIAHAGEPEILAGELLPEQQILRAGKTFAWVRALEADAAREPANADIHSALALGYFLLGQRRFAKEESERALALDPGSLEANYVAGRIAMELDQDYRAAIGRFQRVFSIAKDSFKARYFLGVCLRNLGERDQALQEFRTAALSSPYDWALVAIAKSELDGGDAHRALDAALKACRMNKSAENLLLTGKAWAALNDNSKAREYLEEAAKADPTWDTPHYLLARIYSQTPGREQQARAEMERFEALRNAGL